MPQPKLGGAFGDGVVGKADVWPYAPRRGLSRHRRGGLRLLLRQALLEGGEVDVGHGDIPGLVAAATPAALRVGRARRTGSLTLHRHSGVVRWTLP